MPKSLKIIARDLEERGVFLGGQRHLFARVGANQLVVLLDNGLTPHSNVLDVGCGCLRGGYWLIHFLRAGHYFGIEPNVAMREAGAEALLPPQVLRSKRPRFSDTSDFDFGVFGVRVDFVIARSVWTHAAPAQIETMLDQFREHAAPNGAFITSYLEAGEGEQYAGTEWVGRSQVSDTRGVIRYHFAWIEAACAARDLSVRRLYLDTNQIWLMVHRNGERIESDEWEGSHIASFTEK